MKRPAINVLLAAALTIAAHGQSHPAIQRMALNPMTVVRIPVAIDRLTTVRFPSPVSDVEAVLVSTERHPQAQFLISFRPGNAFLSLVALATNNNTTLNVVWKDQTYVLELVESPNPWLSVIFDAPPESPAISRPRAATTSRLLGLLDTAKAFGLLKEQHPAAVAGVEVSRPNKVLNYGEYDIRIEEIFRFDPEDTLVFRLVVVNKTAAPISYFSEGIVVQVGRRFLYPSITDASGNLPALSQATIYFATTGNTDGSRAALSPENDFKVWFPRMEEAKPPAPAPTAGLQPRRTATPAAVAPRPTATPAREGTGSNRYSPAPTRPAGAVIPQATAPRPTSAGSTSPQQPQRYVPLPVNPTPSRTPTPSRVEPPKPLEEETFESATGSGQVTPTSPPPAVRPVPATGWPQPNRGRTRIRPFG